MARTYLGDGLYADVDGAGQVVLTTSDGIRDTNTIYLEPEVMICLLSWWDQLRRPPPKENRTGIDPNSGAFDHGKMPYD